MDIIQGEIDKDQYAHMVIHDMKLNKRVPKNSKNESPIRVEHTVVGSPTLICGNANYNISISHYKKYVAIAISDSYFPIGIDIDAKHIEKETYSVFMSNREISMIEENEWNALSFWCAKEAITKLLRTGIFCVNLKIFEIKQICPVEPGIYQIEYVNFRNICTIVSDKTGITIAISFFRSKEGIYRMISELRNISRGEEEVIRLTK